MVIHVTKKCTKLRQYLIFDKKKENFTLPSVVLSYVFAVLLPQIGIEGQILPNSRLAILPSLLIGKSGRLYIRVVGRLFVRHGRDSSDVILAFEDAQVIQTVMDDE